MTTPSDARSRFVLLVCVIAALGTVPAHAKRKAPGCTAGRFAVTQGSEMLGGGTMITLDGRGLAIEGACPTTGKVGKTGRKGTAVSARWNRCGAIERVRLQATTARDCSGIRGKIRARGHRRAAFAAVPSVCGDGVADPGAGEECDGNQGCAEGDACSASCTCERAPEPMDCVVQGYPCAWGDVAPGVAAQSVALAKSANAILGGGGSVADAIHALEAAGAVAIESQGATIRFRLAGGRPLWIGVDGPHASTAAASETVAMRAALASADGPRLHPRSVVDTGRFPKSALALAPFAWDEDYALGAPTVAGLLNTIDDYTGNVLSAGNTSVGERDVGLQTFASLDGYNVLYVRSGSTQACTPDGSRCFTGLAAAAIPGDAPWAGFDGAAPGVDLAIDDDGMWFVLVSADFFRNAYPHGLHDVLVVLDAGHTGDSDLARSLSGARANVTGWTGFVTAAGTEKVIVPFLKGLADGRSTSDVYTDLGQNIQDVQVSPPADLVIGRNDIRIRDLVDVTDPVTLEPVRSDSLLGIDGYTDDDLPDHLVLLLDFLGASPDEPEGYTVQISIDGTTYVDEPLDGFATYVGDRWWNRQVDIDLGFDVHEQQPLDIVVCLHLPEGGASVYHVVPRATGLGFTPGEKWIGHFTRKFSNGTFEISLVVDATLERDVTQDPSSKYPEFLLTGGTMQWSLADIEGDNCVHTAPPTITSLKPDENSYLKFDLTAEPPTYYGFARTEGPQVELVRSCPGTQPVISHTQAGGVWFQAPSDENYPASPILQGIYESAAALPSVHEWTITRVQ